MHIHKQTLSFLVILSFVFIFSSCTKKSTNEISKDIQKGADTLSHKLNRDVDTVVNNLTAKDSLFNSVKAEEVDTSKLPSKDFRKKNNHIFSSYIDIEDYLSKDDSISIRKSAKDMQQSLLDALSEGASEKISDPKKTSGKLEKTLTDLQNASSLAKQRELFSDLTENTLDFIKVYGLNDKTIYYLNCDKIAANKKNGWMVDKKNTDNPYYGKDKTNERSVPCADITHAWKFD